MSEKTPEMVQRVIDAVSERVDHVDTLCTWEEIATCILQAMRDDPPHSVIRAMAESVAVDDEGAFPPLTDIIDCSGENKTHTILRAAWSAAIDASLGKPK